MSYTPKFIVRTSAIVMMVGFVAGYVMFQAQNIWNGPIVIIENPADGSSSEIEIAEVEGTARNVAFLTLNGKQIFTDKDGRFAEKLLLSEGYNVVRISARDKFGRNVDKTVELVYKEKGGYSLSVNDENYGQTN